ncbi:MAG: hypothetical protein K1X72_22670 [Pyrinomonadaceae bacterium]|nr:hypothetical protein [Pyrinomonadaceae bacterium]
MSNQKSFLQILVLSISFSIVLVSGCSVAAKSSEETPTDAPKAEDKSQSLTKNSVPKGRIRIESGSPADTVRLFYKNLREKRYREAMMLTNMRAAVEGLSESEMQDLTPDFEPLSTEVPAELEINGEIITNNLATVTAKLPSTETGRIELTQLELRLENNKWVMLIAEADAEALAKKEGKNYFFKLRIDTHHVEAQNMMERIAKAQTLYSMQNNGTFGEVQSLIEKGFLPNDVLNTQSTGYRFTVKVEAGGSKYFATAEPAVYGRTGKLSFLLEGGGADQKAVLKSDDKKGQPMKK